MVGQYPFDERRARPRHPDDEDRLRGFEAAGLSRERRGSSGGGEQRFVRSERLRTRGPLPALAALEIAERLSIAADILGLLCERVAEMQLRVLSRLGRELAFELGDLRDTERRLRDLRESGPR